MTPSNIDQNMARNFKDLLWELQKKTNKCNNFSEISLPLPLVVQGSEYENYCNLEISRMIHFVVQSLPVVFAVYFC